MPRPEASITLRPCGRESAMQVDSVKTTHPVVRHVETVEQISQAFDSITYQKGEAVIAIRQRKLPDPADHPVFTLAPTTASCCN